MSRFSFLYRDQLPHRAIAVFMYLYDRANKEMQCFPAIPTIAHDLKLSESTVKRALGDLEKAGYLQRESRFRKLGGKSSNLYTLKTPPQSKI